MGCGCFFISSLNADLKTVCLPPEHSNIATALNTGWDSSPTRQGWQQRRSQAIQAKPGRMPCCKISILFFFYYTKGFAWIYELKDMKRKLGIHYVVSSTSQHTYLRISNPFVSLIYHHTLFALMPYKEKSWSMNCDAACLCDAPAPRWGLCCGSIMNYDCSFLGP